jgi:hypothetical protein
MTNADAFLLSHDVCTVMMRNHKCGLYRTYEESLRIFTGIQTAYLNMNLLQCSHLSRRSRPLKASFAQNVRMALRSRQTAHKS